MSQASLLIIKSAIFNSFFQGKKLTGYKLNYKIRLTKQIITFEILR